MKVLSVDAFLWPPYRLSKYFFVAPSGVFQEQGVQESQKKHLYLLLQRFAKRNQQQNFLVRRGRMEIAKKVGGDNSSLKYINYPF